MVAGREDGDRDSIADGVVACGNAGDLDSGDPARVLALEQELAHLRAETHRLDGALSRNRLYSPRVTGQQRELRSVQTAAGTSVLSHSELLADLLTRPAAGWRGGSGLAAAMDAAADAVLVEKTGITKRERSRSRADDGGGAEHLWPPLPSTRPRTLSAAFANVVERESAELTTIGTGVQHSPPLSPTARSATGSSPSALIASPEDHTNGAVESRDSPVDSSSSAVAAEDNCNHSVYTPVGRSLAVIASESVTERSLADADTEEAVSMVSAGVASISTRSSRFVPVIVGDACGNLRNDACAPLRPTATVARGLSGEHQSEEDYGAVLRPDGGGSRLRRSVERTTAGALDELCEPALHPERNQSPGGVGSQRLISPDRGGVGGTSSSPGRRRLWEDSEDMEEEPAAVCNAVAVQPGQANRSGSLSPHGRLPPQRRGPSSERLPRRNNSRGNEARSPGGTWEGKEACFHEGVTGGGAAMRTSSPPVPALLAAKQKAKGLLPKDPGLPPSAASAASDVLIDSDVSGISLGRPPRESAEEKHSNLHMKEHSLALAERQLQQAGNGGGGDREPSWGESQVTGRDWRVEQLKGQFESLQLQLQEQRAEAEIELTSMQQHRLEADHLITSLQQRCHEADTQILVLRRENQALQQQMSSQRAEAEIHIAGLQGQRADDAHQISVLQARIKALEADGGEKDAQVLEMQRAHRLSNLHSNDCQDRLQCVTLNNQSLHGELGEARQELAALTLTKQQLQSQLEIETTSRGEAERHLQALQTQCVDLQARYQASTSGLRHAQSQGETMDRELRQARFHIEETNDLATCKKQVEVDFQNCQEELLGLRKAHQQERSRAAHLQQANEQLQNDFEAAETLTESIRNELRGTSERANTHHAECCDLRVALEAQRLEAQRFRDALAASQRESNALSQRLSNACATAPSELQADAGLSNFYPVNGNLGSFRQNVGNANFSPRQLQPGGMNGVPASSEALPRHLNFNPSMETSSARLASVPMASNREGEAVNTLSSSGSRMASVPYPSNREREGFNAQASSVQSLPSHQANSALVGHRHTVSNGVLGSPQLQQRSSAKSSSNDPRREPSWGQDALQARQEAPRTHDPLVGSNRGNSSGQTVQSDEPSRGATALPSANATSAVGDVMRQGFRSKEQGAQRDRQVSAFEKQMMVLNGERQILQSTLLKFPANCAGRTIVERRQKREAEERMEVVDKTLSDLRQRLRQLGA